MEVWNPQFFAQFQFQLIHSKHSTLIIYAIWLKFPILKILSRNKKISYDTSIITSWYWFIKHGWSFTNNLYILYFHTYTHIYIYMCVCVCYVNFLGEYLFFVYLDKKYSSPSKLKIFGSATSRWLSCCIALS